MTKILVKKENWLKYCDAVGDFNALHRSEDFAKQSGLDGCIAPGMWIASHLQSFGDVVSLGLKFKGNVYDESCLDLSDNGNGNYKFCLDNKVVCEARGVKFSDSGFCDFVAGGVPDANCYNYEAKNITEQNVKDFYSSIGLDCVGLPGMFVASLSAPALLDYGREKNMLGYHTSQTFNMHQLCDFGDVEIRIAEGRSRGANRKYNLFWLQNKELIASGNSGIYFI